MCHIRLACPRYPTITTRRAPRGVPPTTLDEPKKEKESELTEAPGWKARCDAHRWQGA
eukprot:gene14046-65806_t